MKHCFSWSCKNKPDKGLVSEEKAQNLVPADTNRIASPQAPSCSQRWVQTSWLGTGMTNHLGLPDITGGRAVSATAGQTGMKRSPSPARKVPLGPTPPSSVRLAPPHPVARLNFSPPSELPELISLVRARPHAHPALGSHCHRASPISAIPYSIHGALNLGQAATKLKFTNHLAELQSPSNP